jgi:hypothetical protein
MSIAASASRTLVKLRRSGMFVRRLMERIKVEELVFRFRILTLCRGRNEQILRR